jgi:mRNA interferase MazF
MLPDPAGSGPGYRRPVVIIQADAFNQSLIGTTLVAIMSSNLSLAEAPGNLLIKARKSGLPRDSVINVSQLMTLDKQFLVQKVKSLDGLSLAQLEHGLRLVLDL